MLHVLHLPLLSRRQCTGLEVAYQSGYQASILDT
jgi:hypothetical protein